MRILFWNCASLSQKQNCLSAFLLNNNSFPHIFGLCETFVSPGSDPPLFSDYSALCKPFSSKGGGLARYYHRSVAHAVSRRADLEPPLLPHSVCSSDVLWCEVRHGSTHFLLGVVYRSPSGTDVDFSALSLSMSRAVGSNLPVALMGDLNARHAALCPSDRTTTKWGIKLLNEVVDPHYLTVVNTIYDARPTRPKRDGIGGTMLDLLLCSSPLVPRITAFSVLEDTPLASDHLPISFSLSTDRLPPPPASLPKFKLERADWPLYKSTLATLLEQRFFPRAQRAAPNAQDDIDQLAKIIETCVLDAAKTAIPLSRPPPSGDYHPWFTREVRDAHRALKKACTRLRRAPRTNQAAYDWLKAQRKTAQHQFDELKMREQKRCELERFAKVEKADGVDVNWIA